MSESLGDTYRETGRECERKGDLDGAKRYYYLALKENPRGYNAIANLTWTEHKNGNTEAAKNLIEKACEARPDKARFRDIKERIHNGILSLH